MGSKEIMLNARKEIDEIDGRIIERISLRFQKCLEIGKEKQKTGEEILCRDRENEILLNVRKKSDKCFNDNILNIYEKILSESREIQKKIKD